MRKYFGKITMVLALITVVSGLFLSPLEASAWRSVHTRVVNGHTLAARADLPRWSDWSGCGDWRAQASYPGPRANNNLTVGWQFTSVGV